MNQAFFELKRDWIIIPLPGTKINFRFFCSTGRVIFMLQCNIRRQMPPEPAVRIAALRLASYPLPGTIFAFDKNIKPAKDLLL